jgi:hypothetical protein
MNVLGGILIGYAAAYVFQVDMTAGRIVIVTALEVLILGRKEITNMIHNLRSITTEGRTQ